LEITPSYGFVHRRCQFRGLRSRGVPSFRRIALILSIITSVGLPAVAAAQSSPGTPSTGAAAKATSTPTPPQSDEDDAAVLDPAEPDLVTINLPTTMRLPLYKGNFRLNHRFAGNLRTGTFSQQASTLFGIDQGAVIGFEYRVAVLPKLQAAAYRSSFDRTIQFHTRYDVFRQRGSWPVAVSGIVSIEGTNNFQEEFAPAVGAVISRTVARRVAAYVTPMWVDNTAASLEPIAHDHDHGGGVEDEVVPHDHERQSTFYVGIGGRIRLLSTVYLVGEITPRANGYAPDDVAYGFGIEKRVGSHMFSLTFTNGFGTTFAQLARGGTANSLYLGFNLARKFF
jgi:hypothetical protein